MKIENFLNSQQCDYASYANIRMIGSAVDGLKNSSRKVVHTMLEKNIVKNDKVENLASDVARFAEYLHGPTNLTGVIDTMAAEYAGANNMPIIDKTGNFGTRHEPTPSAARYIFARAGETFFNMFKKEDRAVLKYQDFEGIKIEPIFFVPTLPLMLVNGSNGIAEGFAQNILARNPKNLKTYILNKLSGVNMQAKTIDKLLMPWYRGFNGTIEHGETPDQYVFKGKISRLDRTRLEISEVPLWKSRFAMMKILDKLEEDKVIVSYDDYSDAKTDTFRFVVKMTTKDLDTFSEDELLEKLKLVSKVTENYTAFDENNKIRVFKNAQEIIDYYIEVKLKYTEKRKEYLIEKMNADIAEVKSKYAFIHAIVNDKLKVSKRKKQDIEKDLVNIPDVIKKNDSYDYLLNMSIYSLTTEKLNALSQTLKEMQNKLKDLKAEKIEDMWSNEINEVKI